MVVGLYFVVRYNGRWAENDSAVFTAYIRLMVGEGRLIPSKGAGYPNGYAYQALSTFILVLTGLDATTLQQVIYPLVASIVVLPGWVLYRELTGSSRGATVATVLLLIQPEFLFVILRSSHEKFTRALLLLNLFLLIRSFKLRHHPWLLVTYVALFYLTAFTMIASNNLLANSFIFAVAIALLLGWLIGKRSVALRLPENTTLHRLAYAALICLGLVYVFTFYAYPPAQHDLLVLQSIWDRIASLLLDLQARSTNAYAQVATGWINLYVYFALSVANWIVLAVSFVIWMRQAWSWLYRRIAPATQVAWLLWLFYAAFAIQEALSLLVDASGAIGSNLQLRIFPSFSMIAVALVASALAQWQPRLIATPIRLGLAIGVGCIAILSVFKATNEPVFSNKWSFYRPAELVAMTWSDRHLKNAEIWTEFDERLGVAWITAIGESAKGNFFLGYDPRPTTRDILVTTITRLRGIRLLRSLPVPPNALRVYSNGEAEIYHLRPQTPYQR